MNKDWEKTFEKELQYIFDGRNIMYGESTFEELNDNKKTIKSFITNLLSTQRQEIIRRILDAIDDVNDTEDILTNLKDLLADLREGNI